MSWRTICYKLGEYFFVACLFVIILNSIFLLVFFFRRDLKRESNGVELLKRLALSMLPKPNITWQQIKRFSTLVDGYITYKVQANTMFSVKRKKDSEIFLYIFPNWELLPRKQGISGRRIRNDLRNKLLRRAFTRYLDLFLLIDECFLRARNSKWSRSYARRVSVY